MTNRNFSQCKKLYPIVGKLAKGSNGEGVYLGQVWPMATNVWTVLADGSQVLAGGDKSLAEDLGILGNVG
jgi:hypothetical protein